MVEVRLQGVVLGSLVGYLSISLSTLLRDLPIFLRALIRDRYVAFSLFPRDIQLPFALMAVEPEAPSGDHGREYEKLDPVPERDVVAVPDEDSDG